MTDELSLDGRQLTLVVPAKTSSEIHSGEAKIVCRVCRDQLEFPRFDSL